MINTRLLIPTCALLLAGASHGAYGAAPAPLAASPAETTGSHAPDADARLILAAAGTTDIAGLPALVGQPKIAKALARNKILRLVDPRQVARIARTPEGKAFLDTFLNDQDWMESFLCSGPIRNPERSLRFLSEIWASDPQGVKTPLYRELATATALVYIPATQHPALKAAYTPVARYAFFKRSHQDGKLHPSFDALKAWDMRYVVASQADNASLAWLQDNIHIPLRRFTSAEGCTGYIAMNLFGNTIHGGGGAPGYHGPWGLGGQSTAENFYRHGGVCGTLSTLASYVSVSRGVPAFTVGQTGHCAYAVRPAPHQWAGGFGGPGGNGGGIYSGNYPTSGLFADSIFTQPDAVLASRRLAWLGTLLKDTDLAKARAVLCAATQAQSLNPESWQEYVDLLAATEAQSPVNWNEVLHGIIRSDSFRLYSGAGAMRLFGEVYDRAAKNLSGEERLAVLVEAYDSSDRSYEMDKYCETLPTTELQLRFAKGMMQAMWKHRGFSLACKWVNLRYVSKVVRGKLEPRPGAEEPMMEILNQSFDSSRLPEGLQAVRNMSQLGQMVTYVANHWDHPRAEEVMAKLTDIKWRPFVSEGYRKILEANKAMPAHPAVPGKLLSEGGMVCASSINGSPDQAFLHGAMLTEAGGLFQSNPQKDPWVTVRLAKPGNLTGIVVAGMFDEPRLIRSSLPMTVSISDDNKTWTTVATLAKPQPSWTIQLEGKGLHARYVKINTPSNRTNLTLRQVLVFGTPSK